MQRALLVILILTASPSFLSAQQHYRLERYTTDNGLPSNGIKGLEWDGQTGFLWIATEAGVTRYNGADFLTFSKANTPELFSERMLLMLKNRSGKLYTVDEAGNVFFIMQNKLQFLGNVTLDTRSSTDKLIGLASSGQLFRQSSQQPPGDFGFNCTSDLLIPFSDSDALIYHADTANKYVSGLYDYRIGKTEPQLILPIASGAKVFMLADQLYLFTREHRFYRLDLHARRQTPIPILFENIGQQVSQDGPNFTGKQEEQLFWESGMPDPILITGSKAWLLESDRQGLKSRLICETVPTDAPLSYVQYGGQNGILFLGTNSKGIVLIRKNEVWTVKKDAPGLDQTSACYSQLALSNGSVMTNRLSFDAGVLGPAGRPASLPVKTASFNNYLLLTPDSILWYSFGDSVYSYSYHTSRTTAFYCEKGSITSGFIESGGRLWLANAVGIGIVQNGRIDYLYRHPQPDVNSHVPFAIAEPQPGLLAIATCSGLLRFDTRTERLDTMLSIPGTCVRALWTYKGYLFIGTYGKGIYLWKNGVIRPIPADKNNYLRYAHCFMPDRRGFCWISTNKGLFKADPDDMVNAFEKNTPEIYYHYYGRNDGMDMTELNGGCTPCALSLNDSTLSFPSMDGLVWIDPLALDARIPEGNIYIDDAWADGEKLNPHSLLIPQLPSNTRELVFQLGFPAWAGAENLYIEYQLEPYSAKWQLLDIQNNPTIRFSNLPPGNYHLSIRKRDGFRTGRYIYQESSFSIAAHWYQQRWAWLLGLCCLIALVMAIVGLRTRQFQIRQRRLEQQIAGKTRELKLKNEELEKTDHIKTRLISIISHDLVTPLRFLHLAGKSLIENKDQLSEDLQQEAVTEIMNTSKELELLSTNILNWIKYRNEDRRLAKENFSLHALTGQLMGIFKSMAKQKQLRLINEVEEEMTVYQYIDPVKVVLYNLMLNGINFTSEGFIRVGSSRIADGVTLIIEDTGVGMTQEQINNIMADHFIISSANVDNRKGNGLGYLIIKDLLKIIRGSLVIRSEKGKGTVVVVSLPA